LNLPAFEWEAPRTLGEVSARLAAEGDRARLIAGGTDLLVKMKRGGPRPQVLLSLQRVENLDRIHPASDGLRVGPLVTMARLSKDPGIVALWTALAEGAAVVGGPIIRNRATIGGNIVNARPCADTVPPLIVLGALLRLTGASTERVVPADGFVTGPGATAIHPDEILTAIELPACSNGPAGSAYIKVTRRAAMEVTLVGCAAYVGLDPGRSTIRKARLVFASVGPTPVCARQAETVLVGSAISAATIAAAGKAARAAVHPITDHRAPADFRSEVVEVIARRAILASIARAGGTVKS